VRVAGQWWHKTLGDEAIGDGVGVEGLLAEELRQASELSGKGLQR
jgi:hypothetical protein